MIRALFVGGVVDNSEMDLDGPQPPKHYPENTGGGASRYSLRQVGTTEDRVVYAVYGAPDVDDGFVERVADERDYARRFAARAQTVH
ncbi:hypothetical protein ACVWZN_003003 [Lysobacter sp. HA35]